MMKKTWKRTIVAAILLSAAFTLLPADKSVSAEEGAYQETDYTYAPAPMQLEEVPSWKGDDDGDKVFDANQATSPDDEGWSGKH